MRLPPASRIVHLLFDVGVITKGVDGALEMIGGALRLTSA